MLVQVGEGRAGHEVGAVKGDPTVRRAVRRILVGFVKSLAN